jgi:hypothetical protein
LLQDSGAVLLSVHNATRSSDAARLGCNMAWLQHGLAGGADGELQAQVKLLAAPVLLLWLDLLEAAAAALT